MAVTLRQLLRSDLAAATALLDVSCAFDRAAAVAAEKLFGGAPGVIAPTSFAATEGTRLLGVAVASGNRIRLLAVDPSARRRGVGTALLAAAESACAASCAAAGRPPIVRTMDQPGNYLAPGVGHYGIFSGRRWRQMIFPKARDFIRLHSK